VAKAKAAAGKMTRVAEGIYRRNGSYLVPIYDATSKKKDWHGANCGVSCGHDRIVDLDSAKRAKRQLEEQKRRRQGRADETVGEWEARWLTVFPRKTESTTVHNAERVRSFVHGDVVSRRRVDGERVVTREGGFKDRSLRWLQTDEGREAVWAWGQTHPSSVKEVRAMLNDALKLRLLEQNPFEHFTTVERRGREDAQMLTVPELDLLLETAEKVHGKFGGEVFVPMIESAAWTMVRPGELCMFSKHRPTQDDPQVNVIEFDAGLVRVDWQWNAKMRKVTTPKWESVRVVPLLPRAETALRALPDFGPGPCFRTKRGEPFTSRTLGYYWSSVRDAFTAKLPADHWLRIRIAQAAKEGRDDSLDFYELRHFGASAFAHPQRFGAPEGVRPASQYEIGEMMGHKDGGKLAARLYIHTESETVSASLRDAWRDQAPRRRKAS
jgi:hypothetical protein